jgi:hydroxylamine dehydrogenase
MTEKKSNSLWGASRLLVVALLVVIVVLGLALVVQAIGNAGKPSEVGRVNALANSRDECVECHRKATPGIVDQYGHSSMAGADVICGDCHEVASGYPGSEEHEGANILKSPTTAMCQKCHQQEAAQFAHSRHGIPAYVAFAGSKDLSPELMAQFEAVPEGNFDPNKARNAIFALEGPEITRFACESCHSIGKPAADGSVGQCQKCHLRHEFSLEQARKPETCNNCHIGPDHPQWEIYQESAHGIAYATLGYTWNWEAEPGTLTPNDFPAATCAICHMSGFGGTATTHDVGDRLTWFLAAQVSTRRPAWQDNMVRMQSVCLECHNKEFIDDFYAAADRGVEAVNARVQEADQIIQPLKDQGLLTAAPFDEPIDFIYFENWHHWGRTAKFGMWMQGADYTQWHGAYEMLSDLADLRELTKEKLQAADQVQLPAIPPTPTTTP